MMFDFKKSKNDFILITFILTLWNYFEQILDYRLIFSIFFFLIID